MRDLADAVDVAAGLLERDDVRVLGQLDDGADLDFAAGAAGHVVEDHGQAEIGDGGEMPEQAGLARPVVVGRHLQGCIGAGILGMLRQLQRLARGVPAGAGDDLAAPTRGRDADLDDLVVLVKVHGWRLACRAHRYHAGDARGDLLLDDRAELAIVYGAVPIERRHQCCISALPHNNSQLSAFPSAGPPQAGWENAGRIVSKVGAKGKAGD